MEPRAGRPAAAAEDPNLAAQIKMSDPTAIQHAVEQYFAQVLRAARGAGLGAQQAEDVTQDTFTTFIAAAPRFEGRSSVRTWLFGILYKKIAEARRLIARDGRTETLDETVPTRFDTARTWSVPGQTDRRDRSVSSRDERRDLYLFGDGSPTPVLGVCPPRAQGHGRRGHP